MFIGILVVMIVMAAVAVAKEEQFNLVSVSSNNISLFHTLLTRKTYFINTQIYLKKYLMKDVMRTYVANKVNLRNNIILYFYSLVIYTQ